MDRVDAFLSEQAGKTWPGAVVWCLVPRESPAEVWVLRRPNQADIGLGDRFPAARKGLEAMIQYEAELKKKP
jgi:hypothetical protein